MEENRYIGFVEAVDAERKWAVVRRVDSLGWAVVRLTDSAVLDLPTGVQPAVSVAPVQIYWRDIVSCQRVSTIQAARLASNWAGSSGTVLTGDRQADTFNRLLSFDFPAE